MEESNLKSLKSMRRIVEEYLKCRDIPRFVILDLLDKFQFLLIVKKEDGKSNSPNPSITEEIEITEYIILMLTVRKRKINNGIWEARDSSLTIQLFGQNETEQGNKTCEFNFKRSS